MKSHRKSRSTENRNARKEMLARGGSQKPTLHEQGPLDRRFRRANRLSREQLDLLVVSADQLMRPTLTIRMDPFTRVVLGYDLS